MDMEQRSERDNAFFGELMFGDESTLHISGKINEHNMHIWETENPREMIKHVQDSQEH
jgi:hypothetical protein